MSDEVSTMIQIGELMYRIGRDLTRAALKVYTSVYYGQHDGAASFHKLQKLCGSHISYLEVETQDKKTLQKVIEKTFGKYHVLYSQLPDLNLSDGRTQFAFNADQIESVKAMLNTYNSDRLEKLKEAKIKYGEGTEKYHAAKEAIEKEFPSIKSITADDYVLSRIDEQGQETPEYKSLEESAKETLKKAETEKQKVNAESSAIAASTTEEKVHKVADAKQKVDYQKLLREGKATRLAVADLHEEYISVAGQQKTFYHLPIDNDNSVVISKSALLDDRTAILIHDKVYPLVSLNSDKIVKLSGKEITSKLVNNAMHSAAKTVGKTAARATIPGAAVGVVKDAATAIPKVINKSTDGGRKR